MNKSKVEVRKITLGCNVVEAEVWIAGKYMGTCEEERFLVSIIEKPTRLEVHADGYFSYYGLLEQEHWPIHKLVIDLVTGLKLAN